MADGPYSRLYHQIADEYPDIFDGPLLAAYCRLLVAADQAWPTTARWAGYVTREDADGLVEAGLITIDGARFHVKGLDKERAARSRQGKAAATARYARSNAVSNAASNAVSSAQTLPRRDKTSKDKTRKNARARTKEMTEEQKAANLARLREGMKDSGLLT